MGILGAGISVSIQRFAYSTTFFLLTLRLSGLSHKAVANSLVPCIVAFISMGVLVKLLSYINIPLMSVCFIVLVLIYGFVAFHYILDTIDKSVLRDMVAKYK